MRVREREIDGGAYSLRVQRGPVFISWLILIMYCHRCCCSLMVFVLPAFLLHWQSWASKYCSAYVLPLHVVCFAVVICVCSN